MVFKLKQRLIEEGTKKMISIWYYIYSLFVIGIIGLLINKKSLLIIFLSLEIILLAINLNLTIISLINNNTNAQLLSLIILTLAAAEASLGLALLIGYYRIRGSIATHTTNLLKG